MQRQSHPDTAQFTASSIFFPPRGKTQGVLEIPEGTLMIREVVGQESQSMGAYLLPADGCGVQ